MFWGKINTQVMATIKQSQKKGLLCLLNHSKYQKSEIHPRFDKCKLSKRAEIKPSIVQNYFRILVSITILKNLKITQNHASLVKKITKIQALIRRFIARPTLAYLRLHKSLMNIRNLAAKHIQNIFRLFKSTQKQSISILSNQILTLRSSAAIVIQKHFKGFFTRKDLFFISPKLNLLLTWLHPAKSVAIIGHFTKPPWCIEIPLVYSKYLRGYFSTFFTENNLSPGKYNIKFIVDGVNRCNEDFPIVHDALNNQVNQIVLLPNTPNTIKSKAIHEDLQFFQNVHEENSNSYLKLAFAAFLVSKPRNRKANLLHQGSTDDFFTNSNLQCFGLAGGSEDWRAFGMDPIQYPRELLITLQEELQKNRKNQTNPGFLEQILASAHKKVKTLGSSTILLGHCHDNKLFILNLGNSGCIVLRQQENSHFYKVFRTKPQNHSIDSAYQLGTHCEKYGFEGKIEDLDLRNFVKNMEGFWCLPQNSCFSCFELNVSDLIIAATDGLLNNLFDDEIINIANKILCSSLKPNDFCQVLADSLGIEANRLAWDCKRKSPYGKLSKNFGKIRKGGILDDICVIVAVATQANN